MVVHRNVRTSSWVWSRSCRRPTLCGTIAGIKRELRSFKLPNLLRRITWVRSRCLSVIIARLCGKKRNYSSNVRNFIEHRKSLVRHEKNLRRLKENSRTHSKKYVNRVRDTITSQPEILDKM